MMSQKNYSKFSQKRENANNELEIKTEVVNAIPNENTIKQTTIDDSNIVEQSDLVKATVNQSVVQTDGYVSDNCNRLYVRKEPNVNSDYLCIIDKSTKVVIDLENSTEDFYKVKTSDGVEGYCMKKFITIPLSSN